MTGGLSGEVFFTDGGWAMFRCFQAASSSAGGVELRSLTGSYVWGPGLQVAECSRGPLLDHPQVPAVGCRCGLWGFSTLPEAVHQEGRSNDRVFALTEHWGEAIQHELGLRSQYAEIVAFIEPTRPGQLAVFPKDDLQASFPDVPIIRRAELKGIIEDRGLVTIPRAEPPPLLQWIMPQGELRWAPKTLKPEEGAVPLPVAAEHPDETISVEVPTQAREFLNPEQPEEPDAAMVADPMIYQLRRATFEDTGQVYAFWERETSVSPSEGFSEVYHLLQRGHSTKMDIHLWRRQS